MAVSFFGTVALDKMVGKSKKTKSESTLPSAKAPVAKPVANQVLTKGSSADTGLYFGLFLPENASNYLVYIINDTNFSFTAHCEMSHNQSQAGLMLKIIVPPYHFEPIGELNTTDISEHPVLSIKIPSYDIDYHYRFKPKSLGTTPQKIALCQEPLLVWKIANKLTAKKANKQTENVDLQDYTKKILKWRDNEKEITEQKNEVARFAHFPIELDLHIEKLVPNADKIKAQNILAIQLNHFEDYLYEALNLRVPKVYIIHGKGDGILREAIHKRLRIDYEGRILSFNNNFHAKYGNGATEIILR